MLQTGIESFFSFKAILRTFESKGELSHHIIGT